MENSRERDNLEILLKKTKLYLSFSISFMAISFPIISLSTQISVQELSEITILLTSNIFLIYSIMLFAISTIFSLYTFNGLNSLKIANKKDSIIKGNSFYSTIIDYSNYFITVGFFLMVFYLSLIVTKNLFLMFCIAGTTIYSIMVFKLIKKFHFNSKDFKKLKIVLVLGLPTLGILTFIVVIFSFL